MRFSITMFPFMAAVAMSQPIEPTFDRPLPSDHIDDILWPGFSKILNKTVEIEHSMAALTTSFKERVRELALAKCEPPFIHPEHEAAQKPSCYKDAYAEIHTKITEESKINPLNVTQPVKTQLRLRGKASKP